MVKFKVDRNRPKQQQKFKVEGKLVIVKRGGSLPPRCIKCNKPTKTGHRQKLSWASSWYSILNYSPLMRKLLGRETTITVGLCPEHHRKLQIYGYFGWATLLVGILVFLLPVVLAGSELCFVAGMAIALTGIIFGVTQGTAVKAVYMDDYLVKIRGCCKEFRDGIDIDMARASKGTEQGDLL